MKEKIKIKNKKVQIFMDPISIGQKSVDRNFPGLVSVGLSQFFFLTNEYSV